MVTVELQVTSAHVDTDFKVTVFGADDSGTVAVHVDGFNAHFYLSIPSGWSRDDAEQLARRLRSSERSIAKCTVANLGIALGYEGNAQTGEPLCPLHICVSTYRKDDFYKWRNALGSNDTDSALRRTLACMDIADEKRKGAFIVRAANVPFWLQFMEQIGAPCCGWVRVNSASEVQSRTTTCEREYEAKIGDIEPLPAVNRLGAESVAAFDIETYTPADEHGRPFPRPHRPSNRIINIGVAFQRMGRGGVDSCVCLCLGYCATPKSGCDVRTFANESKLLSGFAELLKTKDPGVMVGYNILGFDYEYMVARATLINFFCNLSLDDARKRWSRARQKRTALMRLEKLHAKALRLQTLCSKARGAKQRKSRQRLTVRGARPASECDCAKCVCERACGVADRHRRERGFPRLELEESMLGRIEDEAALDVAHREFGCQGMTSFFDADRVSQHGGASVRRERKFSAQTGSREIFALDMVGRVNLDLLEEMRKKMKLVDYKLKTICTKVLGEGGDNKHELSYEAMFQNYEALWAATDAEGRAAALERRATNAEYCAQDCRVLLKLLDKLSTLVELVQMARVTGTPMSDLTSRMQSCRVFNSMVRAANKRGMLVASAGPPPPADGFTGGFVLPATPGMHFDFVATLDFAALYPSIIKAYNLCPSTHTRRAGDRGAVLEVDVGDRVHRFVREDRRRGLLPQMVGDMLKARGAAKRRMRAAQARLDTIDARIRAGESGLKSERDAAAKEVVNFDCEQKAIKVSANSMFGVFGSRNGALSWQPLASSVTALGRSLIERTKAAVEELLPGGERTCDMRDAEPSEDAGPAAVLTWARAGGVRAEIIYGDTDSVMPKLVGLPQSLEGLRWAWRIADALADRVTHHTFAESADIVLEAEDVAWGFLLWETKKRYVKRLVTPDPWTCDVKTKGIETARRDTPPFVRSALRVLLRVLFPTEAGPPPSAEAASSVVLPKLREIVRSLCDDRVALEDYVLTKSLKHLKDYKQPLHIPQLQAAERARARIAAGLEPGPPPRVGERFGYVVVAGIKPKVAERAEHPDFVRRRSLPVDRQHYLRLMRRPIEKLLVSICPREAVAIFDDAVQRIRVQMWPTTHKNRTMLSYVRAGSTPDDDCHQRPPPTAQPAAKRRKGRTRDLRDYFKR